MYVSHFYTFWNSFSEEFSSLTWINPIELTSHYHIFSAVFTWTNLLVVVVELDGSESEALDLVALVTSAVLEEHHLVVGVVVVVDPGVVPINSRGEKQRMHLRDGFLADQLDPIYVAYNMWTRPAVSSVRQGQLRSFRSNASIYVTFFNVVYYIF